MAHWKEKSRSFRRFSKYWRLAPPPARQKNREGLLGEALPAPVYGNVQGASSSAMLRRNCVANMVAVVATARKSATGSARKTAKALSAKKFGRM